MQNYTRQDAVNIKDEILEKADVEPVLLTQASKSSYILMSVDIYERLINRLSELEDMVLENPSDGDSSQNQLSENTKLVLSKRDSEYFISVMKNPPEPSIGLRVLFD